MRGVQVIYYYDYLDYEDLETVHGRFIALERKRVGSSGRLSYLDEYTSCHPTKTLAKIVKELKTGDILVARSTASITSFKILAATLKERVHDPVVLVIENPYYYLKSETKECDSFFKIITSIESKSFKAEFKNSPIGKKLDKKTVLEIEKLRESGASLAKISRTLGIAHETAKKYSKNVTIKVDKKLSAAQKDAAEKIFYKKDYSKFPFLGDDILTLVMRFMLHQRDPGTQRIYYYDFKHAFNFFGKKYGNIQSTGYFCEDKLQEYLDFMTRTEASVRVIRRRMYNLKSFFKYLVIRGDLKINPVDLLRLPKIERYEVVTPGFTASELKKLINYKIDAYKQSEDVVSRRRCHRNLMIVKLLASTGMRATGIVNLKKKDVSFHDGKVILRIYRKGKADQQHMLLNQQIGQDLMVFMDQYLKELDGSTPVFFSQAPVYKAAISVNGLNRMLKQAFKKIGINDQLSAHSFRVTFAEQASHQLSLQELAKQLDHSDIKQTASYLKNTQKQIETPWALGE